MHLVYKRNCLKTNIINLRDYYYIIVLLYNYIVTKDYY